MSIPVILITGFLGSGKTSFLNWLLAQQPDTHISVILNEFGDIKLESHFIQHATESVVELKNGCICCVAQGDIPRTISYILDHSPQTKYIVIEASGLSDPDPVRAALQDPVLTHQVYLESTICIIDSLHFLSTYREHSIISAQLADADLLVINKAPLVSTNDLNQLKQLLNRLTPDTPSVVFSETMESGLFLPPPSPKPRQIRRPPPHDHQHEAYDTYWYQTNDVLDPECVRSVVSSLPPSVIRVKGIFISNEQHQPTPAKSVWTIQRVGSRTHLELLDSSKHQPTEPASVVLCIGKQLDKEQLATHFDSCRRTSGLLAP